MGWIRTEVGQHDRWIFECERCRCKKYCLTTDRELAIDSAREAGWRVNEQENKSLCPGCKNTG